MPVVAREPCPSCRSTGGDTAGDNLARYADGGAFCFVCEYREPKGMATKSESKTSTRQSKLTLDQAMSYPQGTDPSRKLSPVSNVFDTRVVYGPTGDVDKIVYPYYEDGAVVGAKVRRIKDKDFHTVGELPAFFGKQACKADGGPVLCITEGEEDAMALRDSMARCGGKTHDVVSITGATPNEKKLHAEADFLSSYRRVYICMDADEAGNKCADKLSEWIGTLTDTYIVKLDPDKHGKDASDYLTQGYEHELVASLKAAKKYEPEGIVNGIDMDLDWLLEPLEEGFPIPYPALQAKLHGIRKAEITTVCAGSGIGKSTLVREISKSLIDQKCAIANVYLENQMRESAQALVALDMNIPVSTFKFKPPPKADVEESFDRMIRNGHTYFYKHFGGLKADSLINTLYYYARSKKCDFIILDHLSIVVSATDTTNERRAIDTLMTQLAKLVVETGVGLIQVVHLKRPGGDKSFATGSEVSLDDLRGSAALEQLSWNVIGLERDQQGDDADFSRIRVLKNRTFGYTGLADTLKYNHDTGRLLAFELNHPDEEKCEEAISGDKEAVGDDRDDNADSTREPLTGDGEVNRRPRGDMESEWSAILS
jgi:twinkle protein